jgi:hypothetical protein
MASVHRINEALAAIRSTPIATIESYSRVLRKEGVLPETRRGGGATRVTTAHAALLLIAVMRGSPAQAAKNAREIGGLVVRNIGEVVRLPDIKRVFDAFKWRLDITFAEALTWMIDRYRDGTIGDFVDPQRVIEIGVHRYWSEASMAFSPNLEIEKLYVSIVQDTNPDLSYLVNRNGELIRAIKIDFVLKGSHHLEQLDGMSELDRAEITQRSFESYRKKHQHDLNGNESITQTTLQQLSKIFKD